jgi:hypothetical protein
VQDIVLLSSSCGRRVGEGGRGRAGGGGRGGQEGSMGMSGDEEAVAGEQEGQDPNHASCRCACCSWSSSWQHDDTLF